MLSPEITAKRTCPEAFVPTSSKLASRIAEANEKQLFLSPKYKISYEHLQQRQ